MGKRLVAALVVIVVLAIAGAGYVALKNQTVSNNQPSSGGMGSMSNMQTGNSSHAGSAAPTATDSVSIKNFAFSPASITVTKGTTVTWTNSDSVAHTVTETDSLSGPNSSDINPGSSYTFTFSQPGTYHYHCSIHAEMTGTVTVTD